MTARDWSPAARAAIGNGYLREKYSCVECGEVWDGVDLDTEPPCCPDCGGSCLPLPLDGIA